MREATKLPRSGGMVPKTGGRADMREAMVMISVNMHGEFGALAYHPQMELAGSEQEEAAECIMRPGTRRILELLDWYGVKATFFVPGIAAVKYCDLLREAAGRGHEIAVEGYSHRNMGLMSEEEQREDIRKSMDTVKRLTFTEPVGFRAAEGELTLRTLEIAKEEGILYSSSLQNYDAPYWNRINESGETLLEIPMLWSMNDAPYYQFYFDPPIPYGQSRIANVFGVLDNWKREWAVCKKSKGCLVLQIDPVISGETSKLMILERFLQELIKDKARIVTGKEIYEYAKNERERFRTLDCFLMQYANR